MASKGALAFATQPADSGKERAEDFLGAVQGSDLEVADPASAHNPFARVESHGHRKLQGRLGNSLSWV